MAESTLWWIVTGVLVALELATGTFYLLMLSLGAVASALAAHAGLSMHSERTRTMDGLMRAETAGSYHPKAEVTLQVNGQDVRRTVSTRMLLSDFLRHELRLTGTHVGCEHGVCGCCTVLLNGRSARSCLTFAAQADGAEIQTIESLAPDAEHLHPIQQAFREEHALQCGYCTPGFVMAVLSHFQETPNPDLSDEGIREAISGNLCRCTGYQNIVAAVRRAHELMTGNDAAAEG